MPFIYLPWSRQNIEKSEKSRLELKRVCTCKVSLETLNMSDEGDCADLPESTYVLPTEVFCFAMLVIYSYWNIH